MKTVDARKLNCPQPLIMTKNALEGGENEIITIVDNDIAKQNVVKYCNSKGFKADVENKEKDIYIHIVKDSSIELEESSNDGECACNLQNKGYLIGTNLLGAGSDELGKLLMKGFIYTISQAEIKPQFMIFLNSGVKITCENSESIDDLKQLEANGTKIVSCGTCLDYYNLKEKLMVGEISNMYDIVELLSESDNVVSVG